MYDFPRAPMGVPRVWAIKRDHGAPLGKRGTHGDGLVVARAGVLVVVGGGVRVACTLTATTTADYPDDFRSWRHPTGL